MQNSALIELLSLFTKDEMRHFTDFVESPYFNKKKPVIRLCRYLAKYHPSFPKTKTEREKIWLALYPGKPYNYGVMKNLSFDLLRLAEVFCSVSRIKEHGALMKSELLGYLYSKNNDKLTKKYFHNARSSDNENADEPYYEYLISKLKAQMSYSALSDTHRVDPGYEYDEATEMLLTAFISELLEHYAMINEVNKVHKVSLKTPMLKEAVDCASENGGLFGNLKIRSYRLLHRIEESFDKESFGELVSIIEERGSTASPRFYYYLWVNLSNHLAFRYHAGDLAARREMFELNRAFLRKEIFIPEGKDRFFIVNFNTIFNIASAENETDWAEEFVNRYYEMLNEDVRDDVRYRCLADLEFRRGNFQNTLSLLSEIKRLHEPHMKAYVKILSIMTFYELGYYENCISSLDAFRQLLKNEKRLQSVIKEKYEVSCKGFRLLLDSVSGSESSREKLSYFIGNTDNLYSRNWFIRKASEIGIEPLTK